MSSLPQGLVYLEGWLEGAEHDALLAELSDAPWLTELSRRVQHYGARYDYRSRGAEAPARVGPLPAWAQRLAARLMSEGHTAQPFDQVIVNEYLPGQGISAHVDHPRFGPVVVSVSLGAGCVMDFTCPGCEPVQLYLAPRSALVLSGAARARWRHGIAKRKSDVVGEQRVVRGRRLSATFRTTVDAAIRRL